MAKLLRNLLIHFLLVLTISCIDVHAKKSRFLSNTIANQENVVIPEESPAVQNEKAARSSQYFPTTRGTYNYGYNYNDKSNEYVDSSQYTATESLPSSFDERKYPTEDSNDEKKNTEPNSYFRNGQYGMSDTRFLENGRYYFDVNAGKGYGAYAGVGVHVTNYAQGGYRSHGNAEYENQQDSEEYNQNYQESQEEKDP